MNTSTEDFARDVSRVAGQKVAVRTPAFSIHSEDSRHITSFLHKDPYSAALDYLRGKVSIQGDLIAAIRFYAAQKHSRLRLWTMSALAKATHSRLGGWLARMRSPAADIAYHYDHSNEFYALFLDPGMNYSCAYFRSEGEALEDAQIAKLDHVCRKLSLQKLDRILDIGCGWGSLLIRAASRYGVTGEGFTLSHKQAAYARSWLSECNLASRLHVEAADYRMAKGLFTKVSSIGMFEHLGAGRLPEYFRRVHSLLTEDGLFLNQGIVRPDGVDVGAETVFLDRHVFPGSGLVSLADVIREASLAGFEPLDIENLRPHYALTCREWVRRLQESEAQCIRLVGEVTYRAWLLYLAASAVNFEDGYAEVHQVLFGKRGKHGRKWLTRDFLYRPRGIPLASGTPDQSFPEGAV